jgi:hypothetical protein
MKLLPTNVGGIDRILRFAIGAGVLSLAFIGPKTPLGYIGLIPLLTAFAGSCPLYTVLGFSTCPVKQK